MTQPTLADMRLAGAHLQVRPVRATDAKAAFPLIHRQDAILRWLAWDGPSTEADLAEAYSEWRAGEAATGWNYRFSIVGDDERFLGGISLRFDGHPGVGDVGYWIAEREWNRGVATEANRLIAWLAFEHLAARALTAVVFVGNDASAHMLSRVGYRCETDSNGEALVGRPTELDRDSWTFGMTGFDFRRARGEWAPVDSEVRLAP